MNEEKSYVPGPSSDAESAQEPPEKVDTGVYISENETYGGKPTTWRGRLENFWYHYKWHTVAGAVVVLIVSILATQIATTPKYDINMIYAGGYSFSRLVVDGEAPYNTAIKSLSRVVSDYNGDGEVHINLNDHFVLTAEEITALKESGNDDLNESRIQADFTDLNTNIIADGYHVILMSEALYKYYCDRYSKELFMSLTPYIDEGTAVRFVDGTDRAAYLSELPFGEMPELCNLPDDTVICLRNKMVNFTLGGGSKDEDFRQGEETVRKILNFR